MASDVINQMQVYLANLEILYQKYRNFHWNVKGPQFIELHKFFEEQYDQLSEQIDVIAERIRIADETPLSSYKGFLDHATIEECMPQSNVDTILSIALADTESIITQSKDIILACEEAKDPANADIVTGMLETFDKARWMLKSLQS